MTPLAVIYWADENFPGPTPAVMPCPAPAVMPLPESETKEPLAEEADPEVRESEPGQGRSQS